MGVSPAEPRLRSWCGKPSDHDAHDWDTWRCTGMRHGASVVEGACPTCTYPSRETVGMVCQTCGTDYTPTSAPTTGDQRG